MTTKKTCMAWFWKMAMPAKNAQIEKLKQMHSLDILLLIGLLPRSTYYYHAIDNLKRINTFKKKTQSQLFTTKTKVAMVIAESPQNYEPQFPAQSQNS